MSTHVYAKADAVAHDLRQQHQSSPGFKSADVDCVRATGVYRVIVRVKNANEFVLPSNINNVDVEVRDETFQPDPYLG